LNKYITPDPVMGYKQCNGGAGSVFNSSNEVDKETATKPVLPPIMTARTNNGNPSAGDTLSNKEAKACVA